MTKPILSSVDFATLHTTSGTPSDGTVTGMNIKGKNKVKIHEKYESPPLHWEGDVDQYVGTDPQGYETWTAQVFIKGAVHGPRPEVTEAVTVTVNNGDDSNPADTNSNVVP